MNVEFSNIVTKIISVENIQGIYPGICEASITLEKESEEKALELFLRNEIRESNGFFKDISKQER